MHTPTSLKALRHSSECLNACTCTFWTFSTSMIPTHISHHSVSREMMHRGLWNRMQTVHYSAPLLIHFGSRMRTFLKKLSLLSIAILPRARLRQRYGRTWE